MVARCRETGDDTCRRSAGPLRSLGDGLSAERIEAVRAELGAISTGDPTLRSSIDSLRQTLGEMAAVARDARELEGQARARVQEYMRAARGFSGLNVRADAVCRGEYR